MIDDLYMLKLLEIVQIFDDGYTFFFRSSEQTL